MDWRLLITNGLLIVICCLHQGDATCVLETDFGFTFNCGFKKSGLFRVRNLGGVKGYVGLGFSVGDELGFPQSLSTTDNESKRRSVNGVRSVPSVGVKSNSVLDVATPATSAKGVQTLTSVNGVKRSKSTARSISNKPRSSAGRLVALAPIPPFKPILPAPAKFPSHVAPQYHHLRIGAAVNTTSQRSYTGALQTVAAPTLVPPFQALPASITKLTSVAGGGGKVSTPQLFRNSLQAATNHFQVRQDTVSPTYDHGLTDNTLTLRTLANADLSSAASANYQLKGEDSLMGHSIKALAQASNLSVEAITAAIAVRQQQLIKQQQQTPPPTTTPAPVTLPPVTKKYPLSSISKVMNAPKEYYPVGYDKNFDDNFASRVELPDTSFYCGDQKHFPGLYADEDLGCMVFHVCAFTDDGLIMKSFLCPESTLFDQTILKCNWWFYVDCKTSVKLYDSNIPISKSYQLMKALAFFSTYKKS